MIIFNEGLINNELSDDYKRKFREKLKEIREWPEYDIDQLSNQIIGTSPDIQEQTRTNFENWIEKISEETKRHIRIFSYLQNFYYIINIILGFFILGAAEMLLLRISNLNSITNLNFPLLILLLLWMMYIIYVSIYTKFKFINFLFAPLKVLFGSDKETKVYFNILLWIAGIVTLSVIYTYIYFPTEINLSQLILGVYIAFLFIPQIFISVDLSKLKYSRRLARQLDKDNPNYRAYSMPIKTFFAIAVSSGIIARELGENSSKDLDTFTIIQTFIKIKENFTEIIPDFELRRTYADSLAPYILLHTFFFTAIIYFIFPNIISFYRTIDILGLNVQIRYILVLGIALFIYVIFIEAPFYLGQKRLKQEKINRLRPKYQNAQIQLERLIDNSLTMTTGSNSKEDLENCAKLRDFYKDEIESVEKYPMHPHRIEIAKWISLTAVIFPIVNSVISSGIFT